MAGNLCETIEMTEQAVLATMTGEHFQPVRLHYKVLDRAGLLQAFKKLRCLDHDSKGNRWIWLYDYEAKKLRFKQSYNQIEEASRPIVIGCFFLRTKGSLLLDLRSCERAILAIPFFHAKLPEGLVKVMEAEVVNSLFPATQFNMQLRPDVLFDSRTVLGLDPQALVHALTRKATSVPDQGDKLAIATDVLKSPAREPLPEIERLPVHFAEDGIDGFTLAVRLRQLVALKHWQGNPDYNLDEAIQTLVTTPIGERSCRHPDVDS